MVRLNKCLAYCVLGLAAGAAFSPGALASDNNYPDVTASASVSTVLDAKNLAPSSKVWALWVSMPPHRKAEVPGGNALNKWTYLSLVLSGSSVSVANTPPGQCHAFNSAEFKGVPAG